MHNRNRRWLVFCLPLLSLALLTAQPVMTLANHKDQKETSQKKDKFVNGHDASDGRLDGRGPQAKSEPERDDRREGRERRADDDRNRGGRDERTDFRRQGRDAGYREGYRAGSQDRSQRRRFDPFHHDAYRDGTSGFHGHHKDRDVYRDGYRDGFKRGYEDGFRGTRR